MSFYDDWKALLASTDLRYDGFVVPTRDALYTLPNGFAPLYRGTSVVFVGVNHRVTLNASYQMLGVTVAEFQGPQAGAIDVSYSVGDDELFGSAQRYFEGAPHNFSQHEMDSLWAWDFEPPGGCKTSSATTRPFCTEFDSDLYLGKFVKAVVPGERIYSAEATGEGPRQDQTISVVGMSFFDTTDACGFGTAEEPPAACGSSACEDTIFIPHDPTLL